MRILLVTATYTPAINGVAIAVSNLKKGLEIKNHDVFVLAPNHPVQKTERKVLRFPSLPNPFIKNYPIPVCPNFKLINHIVKNIKPDVVHVHHPFYIGYIARIIAKKSCYI